MKNVYKNEILKMMNEKSAKKLRDKVGDWEKFYIGLTSQLFDISNITEPQISQIDVFGFYSLCADQTVIGYIDGQNMGHLFYEKEEGLEEIIIEDEKGLVNLNCYGQRMMYINGVGDLYEGYWNVNSIKLNFIFGKVDQVVSGENHYLWLTQDNDLYGLGKNDYGQLGVEDMTILQPRKLATNVIQISTGSNHTIYLSGTGSILMIDMN